MAAPQAGCVRVSEVSDALFRAKCKPAANGTGLCPACRKGVVTIRRLAFGSDVTCSKKCDPKKIFDALRPHLDDVQPDRPTAFTDAVPLSELAVKLSPELLAERPPPRRYVLWTTQGDGVLATGKVGLLGARGGTGKSFALTQLAVAVATCGVWFGAGGWKADRGRVLLVLAEEDAEEALRRLHASAIGCSEDALNLVARDITVLPLAGRGVALTREATDATGALPETTMANEIRELLRAAVQEHHPYSLVVLDPLSRFAGGDVEKDNSAATRFVQVLETFAAVECGGPTVLASHHLRKQGKEEAANLADLIRGASGLVDGVRWAAVLAALKRADGAPQLLRLEVPKTNYAKEPPPLTLCRPENGDGTLRVATDVEIEQYEAATSKKKSTALPAAAQPDQLKARLLELLRAMPASGRDLRRRMRIKEERVHELLGELHDDGFIVRTGWKWHPTGKLLPASPASLASPGSDVSASPASHAPLGGREGSGSTRIALVPS
jgi:RecA-family ATPase